MIDRRALRPKCTVLVTEFPFTRTFDLEDFIERELLSVESANRHDNMIGGAHGGEDFIGAVNYVQPNGATGKRL